MTHRFIQAFASFVLLFVVLITCVEQSIAISWSGTSWRLTNYSYFDGAPAITQTSNGDIWIAWTRDLIGYYIPYYQTSSDLGATWSQPKNLTAIQGVGDNFGVSIGESSDGTIWAVWASNSERTIPQPPEEDFYMNATPTALTISLGGNDNSTITVTSMNSFTDTVSLSTTSVPDVTSILNPSQVLVPPNENITSLLTVAVEPSATPGNYTLTVIGDPVNHKFLRTVDIALEIIQSGQSSQSNILPSSPSAAPPSVEGEVDWEIYFKTSSDNGATWSNDTQLTDNTYGDTNPSFVQLANGTIMVVWQSDRNGFSDIFYKTTSDGISWSDEEPITTYSGFDSSPCAFEAADGRIWLAWTSNRTGDFEIFYKTYDGLWSSPTNLTYSPRIDTSPSMLQTIDDKILVFWTSTEDTVDATGDIYYKSSSNNGVTWTDSIQFTTDSYEDTWSAVTQTSDTKIWVVWTSDRIGQPEGQWEIYCKTSLVGDLNSDGIVDAIDIDMFAQAYGHVTGEPEYSPNSDFNKDGFIDVTDMTLICRNHNST